MAEQRSTPEEKLLKLIEKEDGNESVRFKRKRNIFLGFNNFWASLNKRISCGVNGLKNGIREPNLKILNKALLVISICLLGFSVMDFVLNRPDIKDAYDQGNYVSPDSGTEGAISKERPFLHYLEMVQRRNIFSPIELKQDEKPEVQVEQLQKMASNFGLVGISWDEEPMAKPMAMIEDKTEKRTYFLRKGDKIGEFNIDDIFESKVILSLEGKTIELI